jgi:hypothetical protein
MPGTLHIFRLRPNPIEYQVNYNLGVNTWVKVLDGDGLEDFLRHSWGFPDSEITAMLDELRSSGRTTEAFVEVGEAHLAEMGFAESPSDE